MTTSALLVWWDTAMTTLAAKHPFFAGVINYVKGLGDAAIPNIPGAIPNLPTPRAVFDYIMGLLIAQFPAEAFLLQIVKNFVDAWLPASMEAARYELPAVPK